MLFCLHELWGSDFSCEEKWSGEKSYFIRKIPRSHKYSLHLMKAHLQADNGFGREEVPSRGQVLYSHPLPPVALLLSRAFGRTESHPSVCPGDSLYPGGKLARDRFSLVLILNCLLPSSSLERLAQLCLHPCPKWLTCISEF